MNQDSFDQEFISAEAPQTPDPTERGVSMADIMTLPDDLRGLVNWIIRQQTVTLSEVVAHIAQAEEVTRTQLETLVKQGFIQQIEEGNTLRYVPHFGHKQRKQLPTKIWQKLE